MPSLLRLGLNPVAKQQQPQLGSPNDVAMAIYPAQNLSSMPALDHWHQVVLTSDHNLLYSWLKRFRLYSTRWETWQLIGSASTGGAAYQRTAVKGMKINLPLHEQGCSRWQTLHAGGNSEGKQYFKAGCVKHTDKTSTNAFHRLHINPKSKNHQVRLRQQILTHCY